MEKNSVSKEVGLRLRRIRMAKGLSQQELAEKAYTSPQNISKYEKEGIANIDTIRRLSEVLETDLLMDEVDQEGTVGEIGSEILSILIDNDGNIETYWILNKFMHGMSKERVNHEIFKLEKIGMCVREEFKDYNELTKDVLFLTAKGLITYKNMVIGKRSEEYVDKVMETQTYEELIGGADSYQDRIEKRPFEKLVRFIPESGAYRINLIRYLQLQLTSGLYIECFMGDPDCLTGVNAYYDIIYRMALGLTNDVFLDEGGLCWEDSYDWRLKDFYRKEKLYEVDDEGDNSFLEEMKEQFEEDLGITEEPEQHQLTSQELFDIIYKAQKLANKEAGISDEEDGIPDEENEAVQLPSEEDDEEEALDPEQEEKQEKLKEYHERETRYNNYRHYPERIYKEEVVKHSSPNPMDWFTKEEIEQFIRKNFGRAKYLGERMVDEAIFELAKTHRKVIEKYYVFPREWEKNGLADLFRELNPIEAPQDEKKANETSARS